MKRRIWREGGHWAASVRRPTSASEAHGFTWWLQAAWYVTPIHQALAARRGRRWARNQTTLGQTEAQACTCGAWDDSTVGHAPDCETYVFPPGEVSQ